jgi:GPI ethanolamine phosphate transferase 3 subunit O
VSSLGTMDRKDDYGDDDVLEASNALWIYSKGPASSSKNPPTFDIPPKPHSGESFPNGLVRQIDLVLTLSSY